MSSPLVKTQRWPASQNPVLPWEFCHHRLALPVLDLHTEGIIQQVPRGLPSFMQHHFVRFRCVAAWICASQYLWSRIYYFHGNGEWVRTHVFSPSRALSWPSKPAVRLLLTHKLSSKYQRGPGIAQDAWWPGSGLLSLTWTSANSNLGLDRGLGHPSQQPLNLLFRIARCNLPHLPLQSPAPHLGHPSHTGLFSVPTPGPLHGLSFPPRMLSSTHFLWSSFRPWCKCCSLREVFPDDSGECGVMLSQSPRLPLHHPDHQWWCHIVNLSIFTSSLRIGICFKHLAQALCKFSEGGGKGRGEEKEGGKEGSGPWSLILSQLLLVGSRNFCCQG